MTFRTLSAVIAAFFMLADIQQAGAQSPLSRALDLTFSVYSTGPDRVFLGSAFAYAPLGVVLSNAHVVAQDDQVLLVGRNGDETVVEVTARDALRDIAILSGAPPGGLWPALDAPDLGQEVFALGAPLEHGFSVSRGILSADPRQIEPTVPLRFLQHDAATNPGSSGGPLIDAEGRLVGMSTRIADGSRLFVGISFAIGAADLARLVPEMQAGTLAAIPPLGLDLRPVEARIAKVLGLPARGALIDDVAPHSAAERAGLRAGDVILWVGGTALGVPADLPFLIEAAQAHGPAIPLGIWRNEATLQTGLRLDPASPAPQPAAPALPLGLTLEQSGTVTAVAPDSIAHFAGLLVGDRIRTINGTEINAAFDPDHPLPALMLIERDGRTFHAVLDMTPPHPSQRRIFTSNRLDTSVHRF